ncbi:MAG: hypothetical protein MUO76_24780 [Anaerolineaceae bacterium]|nr:hypothetical protein [Anaerolineaceae bacterium]
MDERDKPKPITRRDVILGFILVIAIGLCAVLLATLNPYRPQSTFITPAIIMITAVIIVFLIVFINVNQQEENQSKDNPESYDY